MYCWLCTERFGIPSAWLALPVSLLPCLCSKGLNATSAKKRAIGEALACCGRYWAHGRCCGVDPLAVATSCWVVGNLTNPATGQPNNPATQQQAKPASKKARNGPAQQPRNPTTDHPNNQPHPTQQPTNPMQPPERATQQPASTTNSKRPHRPSKRPRVAPRKCQKAIAR